jgi:hypothetical protein
MGIRLYPQTENVEHLEILAGVPKGTTARLDALAETHGGRMSGGYYTAVHKDPVLNCLHWFQLFGYGKFFCPESVDFDAHSTNDTQQMSDLIKVNELNVNYAQWAVLCDKGVYWS